MTLSIRPVTKANWRELSELRVREDQTHFVVSNIYSIAESHYGYDDPEDVGHWDMYPYGIYDDELPVGFLMYGVNYSGRKFQTFIVRLMVDEKHQGKGYGKFGMQKLLEEFREDNRIHAVGISYEPENEAARKLYASLGFLETGEMYGDETLAVIHLR